MVSVPDGQTIALGGLIENRKSNTDAGIPGLADIPVIGALFRNRTDKNARSELLILITPKVVRNGQEIRSVTRELRERINASGDVISGGIAPRGPIQRIFE